MCTNSAHVTNHSCSSVEEKDTLFSTQDKQILSILDKLEESANVSAISKTRLSRHCFQFKQKGVDRNRNKNFGKRS